MFAKIAGTGSALPERVVDNFEIAQNVDTSDEWIQSITGVRTRHIAGEETAVSLAIDASKEAIKDAGISPEEIDLVIVSTVSAEQLLPCLACEVQAAVGADNAAAFDVNAACTGFITAYQIAVGQMKAGLAKTALIIGTECLSNIVDWTDRGTCILFGDGAGAAVLKADTTCETEILPMVLHADGRKGGVLTCGSGTGNGKSAYGRYVQMDGKEIYRFAVKEVPMVIKELLSLSGWEAGDVDYFVLHQANRRIIEAIAKRLHLDESRFPMNMMDNGNMSSASIPVLLDSMNKKGMLKPGTRLIIAGFGAGLTWGGTCLTW